MNKPWKPSLIEPTPKGWRPSRNPSALSPQSRFMAEILFPREVDAIQIHARGRLLDLGCGRAPYRGVYGPITSGVTGVDWPGSFHDNTQVDVFADLNEPLPLEGASYDTILSTSVLEHVWNHGCMWSEMARVLRPGGRLILSVPFFYPLHEQPHDYLRWTPHGLRKACEESGLRVVSLQAVGGALDVVADTLVRLAYGKSRWVGRALTSLFLALLRRGPFRRYADRSADTLPLTLLLVAEKP